MVGTRVLITKSQSYPILAVRAGQVLTTMLPSIHHCVSFHRKGNEITTPPSQTVLRLDSNKQIEVYETTCDSFYRNIVTVEQEEIEITYSSTI
jgi:hypothetical protein